MTKNRFYSINGLIILAFAAEHFFSNVYLPNILEALHASSNVQSIISLFTIVLWIVGIILWWKFIKHNHSLVQKNIFPLMLLSVIGALLFTSTLITVLHLIEPLTLGCLPNQDQFDTLTGTQIDALADSINTQFETTGICPADSTAMTIHYSPLVDLPLYIPLLIIALVSYIRGRKKNIIDIKKEELFQ